MVKLYLTNKVFKTLRGRENFLRDYGRVKQESVGIELYVDIDEKEEEIFAKNMNERHKLPPLSYFEEQEGSKNLEFLFQDSIEIDDPSFPLPMLLLRAFGLMGTSHDYYKEFPKLHTLVPAFKKKRETLERIFDFYGEDDKELFSQFPLYEKEEQARYEYSFKRKSKYENLQMIYEEIFEESLQRYGDEIGREIADLLNNNKLDESGVFYDFTWDVIQMEYWEDFKLFLSRLAKPLAYGNPNEWFWALNELYGIHNKLEGREIKVHHQTKEYKYTISKRGLGVFLENNLESTDNCGSWVGFIDRYYGTEKAKNPSDYGLERFYKIDVQ